MLEVFGELNKKPLCPKFDVFPNNNVVVVGGCTPKLAVGVVFKPTQKYGFCLSNSLLVKNKSNDYIFTNFGLGLYIILNLKL